MFKKIKWFVLAICIVLPTSALALTGYSSDIVILEKDQVINGNYYAAGNTIEINGTVNGDIFVAGDTIVIDSENINGDIFAAGSNITVKGKVNGSLRLVGENIDLMGEVTRNAMVAGKSFRVDSDSKLAGHLTFWGQMVNVAGEIGRLEGAFSNMRLSGTVNNDVDIYLSEPTEEAINISDEAVVNGTLYYKALKESEINSDATIGDVSFNEIVKKTEPSFDKGNLLGWIVKFFGMFIVGIIALYLWPKFVADSYSSVYKKPVKTFFKGLLLLIVTPLASILIAATIVGLPLSIIVMVLWAIAFYLAKVMAAWLIGKFIKDKLFSNAKWRKVLVLALGILIYILLGKIPFIGFMISMLIYIFAWGTFANTLKFKKD
ncbi:polymer-forming cytoskeletal protein [Candidatus Parcubacteria bacterium]|jgi:cytoskeletal protein CcmA (bactofilin family)|nr:polymer-forming cytoskeletal protein [Candidatus Parcubacteria bacterium]